MSEIDFTPPKGAQEAARRALEVRARKPPSQRGMTPVGLARARDLANGKSLSPETVRRMLAYFTRHQKDKQGSTWGEQGKGWQAWNGWGGDAGWAWARKVVRQLESRQMSESIIHAPSVPITMSADPVSQSAIQVARPGSFRGHPQGGFVMDGETFAGIIRNFESSKNRRIPVDYEHATEMVSAPGVLQNGAPAVGWITSLQLRGDDLWATVDWVDTNAVEAIRSGRYAYCSPAVVFGAVDPESGEPIGARLTSVALTNRPFLDGMEPLTARDPRVASLSPESVHIPAAAKAERKTTMEDEKKMAEMPEAPPSKAMARLRAMAAKYMAMHEHEATENEIMEAIEALLEKFEASQAMEAASMSDRVIAEGRAPASARDRLVKLCRADRVTFDALYPASEAPAADARLMSTRVAPQGGAPVERAPAAQVRHADAAADRAAKLMSDNSALSYKDALLQASRELRDEALRPLTAILGGIK